MPQVLPATSTPLQSYDFRAGQLLFLTVGSVADALRSPALAAPCLHSLLCRAARSDDSVADLVLAEIATNTQTLERCRLLLQVLRAACEDASSVMVRFWSSSHALTALRMLAQHLALSSVRAFVRSFREWARLADSLTVVHGWQSAEEDLQGLIDQLCASSLESMLRLLQPLCVAAAPPIASQHSVAETDALRSVLLLRFVAKALSATGNASLRSVCARC